MLSANAVRRFRVVGVKRGDSAVTPGIGITPEDVLHRFEGRTFTLLELEQRGVRIAGGEAVCAINGLDWLLDLAPVDS